jgi:ribonuclease E
VYHAEFEAEPASPAPFDNEPVERFVAPIPIIIEESRAEGPKPVIAEAPVPPAPEEKKEPSFEPMTPPTQSFAPQAPQSVANAPVAAAPEQPAGPPRKGWWQRRFGG